MLMFDTLNFGVMIDAGLFDPAVRTILNLVGGDGSTTCKITCATRLPLCCDCASAGCFRPA